MGTLRTHTTKQIYLLTHHSYLKLKQRVVQTKDRGRTGQYMRSKDVNPTAATKN